MSRSPLDAALQGIGGRLDAQRQSLYYLDSDVLRAPMRVSALGREVRAMAYVAGSAALEHFVYSTLDAVVSEVAAAACPLDQLRLSLFALVCEPELDSLRTLRMLQVWDRRSSMFERLADGASTFTALVPRPLDGRTLRGGHFATMWRVFGFPGPPLPSGIHIGILEDLATNRNDVAHGDAEPQAVGRRKTTNDVLRMLQRIEEIALHLNAAAEMYLDVGGYRR